MSRKQMKKQGKQSLKKHYFIFVAACLIAGLFVSGVQKLAELFFGPVI